MATKLTPLEQALDSLQSLQVALLRDAAGGTLTPDRAQAISDEIGKEVATIRRIFARASQALRGESA